MNCSSISVLVSSNDNEDLSDDQKLWTIKENQTRTSVMIASNQIKTNKFVSADLQPRKLNYFKALRATSFLKWWSFSKFSVSLQAVMACSLRKKYYNKAGRHPAVFLISLGLFQYNFTYASFRLYSLSLS